MITLIFVLAALVVLTSWDSAEAEANVETVRVRADDRDGFNR